MNRDNWEKKKLGEIATYINGFAFKPTDWEDNGLPIIRIQNLNSSHAAYNYTTKKIDEKYIVEDGDILISWSASLGVYEWKGKSALLNQHIFKVLFNRIKINKFFFKYQVTKQIEEMLNHVHGATMKHITKKDFDKIDFFVPSSYIQEKIVKELDILHEILAKKKEQLKDFDKLVQATFYDMFSDPVENEKGWEKGFIKDTVSSVNYGTSSPATQNGKFKYLRMNNITYSGYLDLKDIKYIDIEEKNIDKYIVKRGDLLFNRTNSKELVGKTAVFTENESMIIAGYIIRIRINDKFNPFFIWGHLNSSYGKTYLRNLCKSIIGMANINAKELQTIPILFPPLSLQDQFAQRIQAIEKQKDLIKQSIADVEQLIGYTMDKYFN